MAGINPTKIYLLILCLSSYVLLATVFGITFFSSDSLPTTPSVFQQNEVNTTTRIPPDFVMNVHNPWDRTRFVCGQPVNPGSTALINASIYSQFCTSLETVVESGSLFLPTRIFPFDPKLPGKTNVQYRKLPNLTNWNELHKVTIRFNKGPRIPLKEADYGTKPCNVPCEVYGKFQFGTEGFVTFEGTPFQIKRISKEGPIYYPSLKVNHNAYKNHQYYATTSFESDIPLAYYGYSLKKMKDHLRYLPPVNFDTAIRGASFIARNCQSKNDRETLVKDLINITNSTSFRIDSLSSCIPHAPFGPPRGFRAKHTGEWKGEKEATMSQYLFHLAFENQNADDYITEKLWLTLKSGTIPVYFGAPNIRDHLPHPNSIIFAQDFVYEGTTNAHSQRQRHHGINATALALYLIEVANNRTLYQSYHAWRRTWEKGEESNLKSLSIAMNSSNSSEKDDDFYFSRYLDKYQFTSVSHECRMCRFSFAKAYGWRWDYGKQEVGSPLLPLLSSAPSGNLKISADDIDYNRSTCFDGQTKQMIYPIQEVWATDNGLSNPPVATIDQRCNLSARESGRMVLAVGDGHGQPRSRWSESPHRFVRTVWDHDGVTDMQITRSRLTEADSYAPSVFQMVTPFANAAKLIIVRNHTRYRVQSNLKRNSFNPEVNRVSKPVVPEFCCGNDTDIFWIDRGTLAWIENAKSRIVLMADWPDAFGSLVTTSADPLASINGTTFFQFKELPLEIPGTITINIPEDANTLRLRWIVEHIDTFHSSRIADDSRDPYEMESFFSSIMVDEFFNPLELRS